MWLGNAKVKCIDTVTLNSPCAIVVSPEFPILVQFVITKALGRFHGHVTAYVHNASATQRCNLAFHTSLPHPWRIICPVCPPRSSLWDNGTRHTIRLGLHGMLPCPLEIYLRDVWLSAHFNGLYITFSILTSAMITQAVKRGGVNRNISRLFSYQRPEDLSVLRTFRRDRHPWRSPMKSAVETTPQHCLEWLAGWFGFPMEFPFFLFDVVGFWLQKKYVLIYNS